MHALEKAPALLTSKSNGLGPLSDTESRHLLHCKCEEEFITSSMVLFQTKHYQHLKCLKFLTDVNSLQFSSWFPVLNNDKCSNQEFLLFLILLLLNFVEAFWYFPCAAPLLILCISLPCCVHLLCLSLTCSLPAVYIHYFSPPLLCVCLPSISLPLLLRVFTASPPPPSTCFHPASSSAAAVHMSLFSATPTGIHTHLPLPAFPRALSSIFHPLHHARLISAHLYTILPSIFLIFWFLLSPYLHYSSLSLPFVPFLSSSLWSVLANWFYRKNVLVCRGVQARIANHSALCQIWGSQLNLQKNPCFFHHAHRVKSPKTLSVPFSPSYDCAARFICM